MKLYTFPVAPNPTRLGIFLAEKGIEIPQQIVNLPKGEQKEPAFLALNPHGALPVLELDDGQILTESLAIMEYLEELHPEPALIGRTPLERARARELDRMIDNTVLGRVARLVHATRSPLPGVEPNPGVAERERAGLGPALAILDARIGQGPFVAGDRLTIADGTLFAAIRFGGFFGIEVAKGHPNIERWHEAFSKRPSAQ